MVTGRLHSTYLLCFGVNKIKLGSSRVLGLEEKEERRRRGGEGGGEEYLIYL